jgi:hypothetical protein
MKRNRERGARNVATTRGGTVRVHIERLVVEGLPFTAADAARLQSTVERELGRKLAGAPMESWSGGATHQLPAAPLHLAPGSSPVVWGRQIARTLFASLTPSAPSLTAKATPTPARKPF